MKKSVISIIVILASVIGLISADGILDFMRAEYDGKAITVKWKSIDESNIAQFIVERAGNDMNYEELSREQAKGYPSSYKYVDESAFKLGGGDNTQAKTSYNYRLLIKKKDGSHTYSDYSNVSYNPSSFRRTWGMLKEMFR